MKELSLSAFAKLNLTLDVLKKRPDGYHDVRMILQTIDLCDEVTVAVDTGRWGCVCDDAQIPQDEGNLAMRAARAFFAAAGTRSDGVLIHLQKKIPSQAGLGGGSADAAAVLRALNMLCGERFSLRELSEIGASVGSDVPFCVLGGTVLAEGRGEQLTPLPKTPDCAYLLLKPSFSASTPALYNRLDQTSERSHPDTLGMIDCLEKGDLAGVAKRLGNVFLPVLDTLHPVRPICDRLLSAGALGACLTGSGSVVYGVFPNYSAAEKAASCFRDDALQVYLAKNLN